MEELIDLHMHTTKSDGALTPKEIIDKAKENGVTTIAIADHDTIDAYTKETIEYAKKQNITLIPAVEISTKGKKGGVHVLGYQIDLNNQEFCEKLEKLRNARHEYLHNVGEKLQALGFALNVEKLDKIEAVTKAHIALDVIENEKNTPKLLEVYDHIPSKGEFIETMMNEGCKAYVKKNTITPKEASDLIKLAGGLVVLAHPVAYTYEDQVTTEETIELLKEMNADGLEANYIYYDRLNNRHDDTAHWKKVAKRLNLSVTIGSDFHKEDQIHPTIGLVNEKFTLTPEERKDLFTFLKITSK